MNKANILKTYIVIHSIKTVRIEYNRIGWIPPCSEKKNVDFNRRKLRGFILFSFSQKIHIKSTFFSETWWVDLGRYLGISQKTTDEYNMMHVGS